MKLLIFLVVSTCIAGTTSAATTPGLNYNYYEGNWNFLPNFNSLTPVKKGTTSNFNLSVSDTNVSYGIVWQGYITISTTGNYTFQTYSDDGSQLFINNSSTPLVNNDGVHSDSLVSGTISLNAGTYPIKVTYFQKGGNQTMEVYWSSNTGLARQKIPDAALTSDVASSSGLTGSRNFYFSSVSGDDNRTELQAQNPATPWKTITKLNTYFPSLQPGDAVLFKRGETFDGGIIIAKSGSSTAPIIFSAFGAGNKPVINGFATVTSWTSLGNNIYEAPLAGNNDRVNMVTVNGVVRPMGRYPNSSYFSVDTRAELTEVRQYTFTGSFTDAQLASETSNWTGAEVVIRKNDFCMDRGLVTSHSGTTINYNSPSRFPGTVGYGYFFQNSPQALDQQDEWYYNPSTKKLRLYSNVNPSTLSVKGTTVKALVTIDNKANLMFDNLSFEGADTSVFKVVNGSSYVNVQNCDINYSATEVLTGLSTNHITFINNTVNNTTSQAINMYSSSYITIKNNIIKNTGMFAGMGVSNQYGYGGVFLQGGNNLIEGNVLDSVGQSPIGFNGGDNNTVKNNYLNYFCVTVGDQGGIYTNGNDGYINKRIIGNILTNGIGIKEGTTSLVYRACSGIYADEGASNVEILDNTVSNCVSNGIYVHQGHEVIIRGNTSFNNGGQLSMVDDQPPADRVRNVNVKNNILFAKGMSQFVLNQGSTSNDLDQFGTFDSNYYARPLNIGGIIRTQYQSTNGEVTAPYDLSGWSNKYPDRDKHTVEVPAMIGYVVSSVGTNITSKGSFDSDASFVTPDGNTTISVETKLDGQAAKFAAKSPSLPDVGASINLGSAVAGKSYRIRFSLIGSTNTQNLVSYIRRFKDPDYSIVSEQMCFPLRTTRTECEYIYTATVNEPNVKLTIIASGMLLPFWIDNLQVAPVEITFNNADDLVRFEFNNTNSVKSVPLDGEYVDVKKNKYSNNVDLSPYTSIILMKVQGAATSTDTRTGTANLPDSILTANTFELSVYPNPVVNVLSTKLVNERTGKATLTIYNVNGIAVQTQAYDKPEALLEKSINVSALPQGVYFAEYKFEDRKSVTKTFVKK